MIAGGHEQLGPYEVQDQELAFVQQTRNSTISAYDGEQFNVNLELLAWKK